MGLFEAVKEQVTARDAAERYGIRVNRYGMAVCPFHPDRNPSMKLDKRFHCFACGADGDVINFVARLFGLKKGARIIPFDEIPEQEIHQTADYSELYQAVMTLPEEQRIAVALYYMEGYSIREIASMEDITQSAVKNRLLRARRTLKTLLENQLEDEE